MDPDLGELFSGWIVRQRWFAGKGSVPKLRMLDTLEWPAVDDAGGDDIRIVTHFVLDEGERPALYQVPVTYRAERSDAAATGYIGELPSPDGTVMHAHDGAHDQAFTAALLRLVVDEGAIGDERVSANGVHVVGPHGLGGSRDEQRLSSSRVLSGEQSNTSIVCTVATDGGERQVICKIFRALHHGENPDVVLQSVLFAAGSDSVPAVVGSTVGQWPDEGRGGARATGHLAFVQEFLAGSRDAWQLALEAAAAGSSFAHAAHRMGTATADVHAVLASALPTRDAGDDDVAAITATWRERLDAAVREVPELEELRGAVERMYAHASEASWPRLQRIHGDLHLGQILATTDDRWAIIDFEGEPLRPLATRSVVDMPLRDVAGMLRSFDYVAGASEEAPGVVDWARECRGAFLAGYSERAGRDASLDAALLDAFEMDKALYEAVYEARNRPSWLPIPVTAARRLAAHSGW